MKKILIAEDNDSNFILMTYVVKGKYEYERARNGKEAVEMVNAGSFDLVLMDLKMPVKDGFQATKEIKSQHPSLPVIALTANVFDVDRQNAELAGCDDFIAKPINRERFIATIKQYLKEEE
ncbi:MAG: response regulator [Prevotella sp.]|jgi:FOG: CheY-like receiver|nr:response regulator [Prevotella sp.]